MQSKMAGFEVHDANIVILANCPNIDLIKYMGKSKRFTFRSNHLNGLQAKIK